MQPERRVVRACLQGREQTRQHRRQRIIRHTNIVCLLDYQLSIRLGPGGQRKAADRHAGGAPGHGPAVWRNPDEGLPAGFDAGQATDDEHTLVQAGQRLAPARGVRRAYRSPCRRRSSRSVGQPARRPGRQCSANMAIPAVPRVG
jgi:hypothetical protein